MEEANEYLCIRCANEVNIKEAIVAEKEHQVCYSRAKLRFNTMANGDLQIFIGAKMIYDGLDPGVFGPPLENVYGPGDGPFLVKGDPMIPPKVSIPRIYDEEAARSFNWVEQPYGGQY